MKMFFNISMLGLELDGAMKINDYFFISYVVLLIIGLLIKDGRFLKLSLARKLTTK